MCILTCKICRKDSKIKKNIDLNIHNTIKFLFDLKHFTYKNDSYFRNTVVSGDKCYDCEYEISNRK